MTNTSETLTRLRYWFVAIIGLAFFISQMASLTFASQVTGLSDFALDRIDDFGALLMVIAILTGGWLYFSAKRRDENLKHEMHDELTQHNLRVAALFGFKITFILAFLLTIIVKTTDISAEDTIRLVLTACLVPAYLRFAWLEAQHA